MAKRGFLAKGWQRWALAALAMLAILYLAVHWPRWQQRAEIATGFGARIACGCRYIDGRSLESCKGDFRNLEGMGLVRLTDDPEARTVEGWVPLLAQRKATFRPGFGCLPDEVD